MAQRTHDHSLWAMHRWDGCVGSLLRTRRSRSKSTSMYSADNSDMKDTMNSSAGKRTLGRPATTHTHMTTDTETQTQAANHRQCKVSPSQHISNITANWRTECTQILFTQNTVCRPQSRGSYRTPIPRNTQHKTQNNTNAAKNQHNKRYDGVHPPQRTHSRAAPQSRGRATLTFPHTAQTHRSHTQRPVSPAQRPHHDTPRTNKTKKSQREAHAGAAAALTCHGGAPQQHDADNEAGRCRQQRRTAHRRRSHGAVGLRRGAYAF